MSYLSNKPGGGGGGGEIDLNSNVTFNNLFPTGETGAGDENIWVPENEFVEISTNNNNIRLSNIGGSGALWAYAKSEVPIWQRALVYVKIKLRVVSPTMANYVSLNVMESHSDNPDLILSEGTVYSSGSNYFGNTIDYTIGGFYEVNQNSNLLRVRFRASSYYADQSIDILEMTVINLNADWLSKGYKKLVSTGELNYLNNLPFFTGAYTLSTSEIINLIGSGESGMSNPMHTSYQMIISDNYGNPTALSYNGTDKYLKTTNMGIRWEDLPPEKNESTTSLVGSTIDGDTGVVTPSLRLNNNSKFVEDYYGLALGLKDTATAGVDIAEGGWELSQVAAGDKLYIRTVLIRKLGVVRISTCLGEHDGVEFVNKYGKSTDTVMSRQNTMTPLSNLITVEGDVEKLYVILGIETSPEMVAPFESSPIYNACGMYVVNLTKRYGLGMEPSQEEMDAMFIKSYFYAGLGDYQKYLPLNEKVLALEGRTSKLNRLYSGTAPTENNTRGVKGEMRVDDDYLYVCVSENIWKKVALVDVVADGGEG